MEKFILVLALAVLSSCQQSAPVKSMLTDIDSPLVDIIWCGEEKASASIIVLSEKGVVYRSVNKGLSWLNMKPYFKTTAKPELDKGDKVFLPIKKDRGHKADNQISSR